MCEVVKDPKPKYSCSEYGNDYKLDGNRCIKIVNEVINAKEVKN